MDLKKVALIGGGIAVVGGALYWFNQYRQTASANNAALQQSANDNDAELAALLLSQPLSSSSGDVGTTEVSGPTVDTGSASLQSLINSILTPSTTTPVTTSSTTPATTSSPVSSTATDTGVSTATVTPTSANTPQPIINGPVTGTP